MADNVLAAAALERRREARLLEHADVLEHGLQRDRRRRREVTGGRRPAGEPLDDGQAGGVTQGRELTVNHMVFCCVSTRPFQPARQTQLVGELARRSCRRRARRAEETRNMVPALSRSF
jgi:hypothetical protein